MLCAAENKRLVSVMETSRRHPRVYPRCAKPPSYQGKKNQPEEQFFVDSRAEKPHRGTDPAQHAVHQRVGGNCPQRLESDCSSVPWSSNSKRNPMASSRLSTAIPYNTMRNPPGVVCRMMPRQEDGHGQYREQEILSEPQLFQELSHPGIGPVANRQRHFEHHPHFVNHQQRRDERQAGQRLPRFAPESHSALCQGGVRGS